MFRQPNTKQYQNMHTSGVFWDIWPGNDQAYNTENEAFKGQRFLTFY